MPVAPSRFFSESLTRSCQLLSNTWRSLRSWPPFYHALIIMAGYATREAKTPVIVITPFQLPNADLPFSGDIVAMLCRTA